MFQRWGFMMGEIWLLLLLAALVGLLAGWFIWGRRAPVPADTPAETGEADRLRTALEACNAKGRDQTARITALEGDLSAAKSAASESAAKAERAAAASTASASAAAVAAQAVAAQPAPKSASPAADQATTASPLPPKAKAAPAAAVTKAGASKATSGKSDAGKSSDAKPESGKTDSGKTDSGKTDSGKTDSGKPESGKPASGKPESGKATSATSNATKSTAPKAADKPKGLTKARGGKPDDLKLIKGVGPKLEALCNKLGFYHFDQIASWTEKEIAWVDENLEGFKGRVTREDWVQQARNLMNGLPPRPGGEK